MKRKGTTSKLSTFSDSLAYLRQVKEAFLDQPEKYDELLQILRDYKAQRIDVGDVSARVSELFRRHQHLIPGFNDFMPQRYVIPLEIEDELVQQKKVKKPSEFENACQFLNKIKLRFEGEGCHVYKSFLDILKMFRNGNKNSDEVQQEVFVLLQDHQDLLKEFTHFLPAPGTPAITYYKKPGCSRNPGP